MCRNPETENFYVKMFIIEYSSNWCLCNYGIYIFQFKQKFGKLKKCINILLWLKNRMQNKNKWETHPQAP